MTERASNMASDQTAREIELQIKSIVDQCRVDVEKLLSSKKAQLEMLAEALVEKETLYYRDVVRILEPSRTDADIEKEIAELAERKLVGKSPQLQLNGFLGFGGNGNPSGAGTPGGVGNNRNADDLIDVVIKSENPEVE